MLASSQVKSAESQLHYSGDKYSIVLTIRHQLGIQSTLMPVYRRVTRAVYLGMWQGHTILLSLNFNGVRKESEGNFGTVTAVLNNRQ